MGWDVEGWTTRLYGIVTCIDHPNEKEESTYSIPGVLGTSDDVGERAPHGVHHESTPAELQKTAGPSTSVDVFSNWMGYLPSSDGM